MIKKILSILCVSLSIIILSANEMSKYNIIINNLRQPQITVPNPVTIPIKGNIPNEQGTDHSGDINSNINSIINSNTANSTNNDNNISGIAGKPSNIIKNLYANSACLMDTFSGRVLYSKDADKPLPMASTTKIMTCILALELGNPNDIVKISRYASSMPDVQLNICENEQYKLNDLLYSLMLESHNDTAVAIAEHIGGSVDNFAKLMNEKAAILGCKDTCFVTPNGLDKDNHHSTASDLCLIAAYAINNPEFIKIIQTPSYNFNELSGKRSFTVNNHDAFLGMYKGAIGIKTGFTGKAGYCFVGAAKQNNMTLVSAVLASGWPPNKSYKWSDTCKLMDYGFNNYQLETILNGPISLQPLPVINELNQSNSADKIINLYCEGTYTLPVSSSDNIYLSFELPQKAVAPIETGTTMGLAHLIVNDNIVAQYPITAANSAHEYSYKDYFMFIIDTLLS